jgi:hypothetical protein
MRADYRHVTFAMSFVGESMRSAMMIGQAFGRLTVLAFVRKKRGYRHWLCRCTLWQRDDSSRGSSARRVDAIVLMFAP